MSQGSQDGGSNGDGGEEEQGHFSMPNTVDKLQVRSQGYRNQHNTKILTAILPYA